MEYIPQIKPSVGKQIKKMEKLEIKNLTFSYPNTEKKVLKGLNFSIVSGERVAIVGRNGSGKSTLVKLIARLYDSDEGDIFVNDGAYKTCDVYSLRENIGIVFQDYKGYAVTIAENVLMRKVEDAQSDAKLVWDALDFASLREKVETLPDGIFSKLTREFGNEGVFLSGGEMQKLALARVYARNCSLIILDEPSSALDPISESDMFSRMRMLSKDKCAIMISHRLSNITDADRIYVMDDGAFIEVGTHEELIFKRGIYYDMYLKQNTRGKYANVI